MDSGWTRRGNATKSLVSFDAYIVPDLPKGMMIPKQPDENKQEDAKEGGAVKELAQVWHGYWVRFCQAYCCWFIDGPTPEMRTFNCTNMYNDFLEVPLPSLLLGCAHANIRISSIFSLLRNIVRSTRLSAPLF